MRDQAQTWHYGLMASWWAEFVTDGGDDLAYFLLELAGFRDVAVYSRTLDGLATPDDRVIVFVARKTS